jgi:chromosome segregation ATPase
VQSHYLDGFRHWRRRQGWRGASTQRVGEQLELIADTEQGTRRATAAMRQARLALTTAANSCPDDRLRRRIHTLAERVDRDEDRVEELRSELGTLDDQLWKHQKKAGLGIERHFHKDRWFFAWPGQSDRE